jgi:hypothetical protein
VVIKMERSLVQPRMVPCFVRSTIDSRLLQFPVLLMLRQGRELKAREPRIV